MDKQITTNSAQETQKFAQEFSSEFKQTGGVILLSGNLGAGKTTFTQGFIKSFGITQHIISPTFLLVRQYQIPNEEDRWIFHLDLYRLAEPINLKESGISEILESADRNIILIEWSEKLGSNLPEKYFKVALEKKSEDSRHITITKNI